MDFERSPGVRLLPPGARTTPWIKPWKYGPSPEKTSPNGDFRGLGDAVWRDGQGRPAMRAVRPPRLDATLATWTGRLHRRAAMRTKDPRLDQRGASRTPFRHGIAQNEEENDADRIGDEDCEKRP